MSRDSYYRECPDCGLHLDPGEACDCKKASDIYNPVVTSATGVSETYLISIDISPTDEKPVFMVSKVRNGRSVEVISCLFGQEAIDAYEKFGTFVGAARPDINLA